MGLADIVKSRRSVRRFTDEQVSREALLKLLDLARWAPHASECWRFIVVQEPERKQLLAAAARQKWLATAPVIIVVGADLAAPPEERAARWDAAKFRDLFPIQGTAAAIQNLMLAAVEAGLGTCWIGSFNEGEVTGIVNFPFAVRPVAMVALGYPKDVHAKRIRRPLGEVVFWETFQK